MNHEHEWHDAQVMNRPGLVCSCGLVAAGPKDSKKLKSWKEKMTR